jgi:very-short-patch-repair endonuclease
MIKILLIVLVVAIIAIIVALKAKSQAGSGSEVWPFYAKKPLSPPEHIILAQVQLSRFLGVKKGHNNLSYLNRINRMSADFVVCNKDSSIVAVIELDDSTHEKADRQAADAKKDKAFEAAEIKIIRWQAKSMPDISTIKSTLLVTKL